MGLARQGRELVRFFASEQAQVTASDRQAVPLDFMRSLPSGSPVRFVFGRQTTDLLTCCDVMCISGGVDPSLPLVQTAIQQGIPVLNDTVLTFARTACPVILITGSSGKTTTTALTGTMLERGANRRQRVFVGGNIGLPLLHQANQIRNRDLLLWEASSFQLELLDPTIMRTIAEEVQLDTVALLNVTPNHLDRHASMAVYLQAKLRALYALRPGGSLVVNADDPVCQRLIPEQKLDSLNALEIPAAEQCAGLLQQAYGHLRQHQIHILPFSVNHKVSDGISYRQQAIWLGEQCLASLQGFRLRGQHNISNALAAGALAHIHGCTRTALENAIQHFGGVPHRLEEVAYQDGVLWINDSIATAPERAIAGINSVSPETDHLLVLAGGQDKDLPWHQFVHTVLQQAQVLITFGTSGPQIARAVKQCQDLSRATELQVMSVDSLDCAVATARQIAKPGSIVLMSPGATSFDAFADYEARGEHFRQLVKPPRNEVQK